MCIWVDANAYKEGVDKEKLFDSLYRIVYALALKQKIFHRYDDYQPFALEVACKLYQRIINPKQFLPDDNPRKMKKIKSILNFVKRIMYPMQVEYQKSNFGQQFIPEMDEATIRNIREELTIKSRSQGHSLLHVEFENYLNKICHTVKSFLSTTPYCYDEVMTHNLYISILLSLLNQMTLSRNNKNRLKQRMKKGYGVEAYINSIYDEEQKDSIMLFHIDPKMYNYVAILVARVRKLIIKDMRDLIGYSEPSDAVIQSILTSPLEAGTLNVDQE